MLKKIVVGKFGQTFGIHGWLKIRSFTDPTSNILNFKPWFIYHPASQSWQEIAIEKGEIKGKNILVKLPGCENPETARLYTNLEIAVEHEQLPTLPPNEFYKADLEGLMVVNSNGIELGTVKYVLETGANDVLIVTSNNTRQELAIPYIKNTILKVDLAQRKIIVKGSSLDM